MGSLSVQLHVDLSTMSRNVTLLERNGHLLRTRNAEDGRIVEVILTARGKRALNTLRCGERDILGTVYDRLSRTERAGIVKALETLSECLVQAEDGAACCPTPRPRTTAS